MKTLEAICVTSSTMKRQQIQFDEVTGLIVSVGDLGINKAHLDYYYNDDCLLFAGMGDVHIHAREDVSGKNNYKEDFSSAVAAMLNGGVTHAGDMPNNPIPPVDDASYEAKFNLAMKQKGKLWLYAGIGPETRPLSYAVPYKVYMGPSIGELFFKDFKTLDETLSHYRGQFVSFHCEDPEVLEQEKSQELHHLRRPAKAEVIATQDALKLIEKYELKGKLCHYSSGEGLEMIRMARMRGVHVAIEVTPQHLFFDQEHLDSQKKNLFQMNPPIRDEKDRLAMLKAFTGGEIQYLATDHAPHTLDEKLKGTSGLTGLDSYGLFVSWLVNQKIDPKLIATVCSENPGLFFNQFLPSWQTIRPEFKSFGKGLGYLAKDYRANFTVLNLNKSFKLTKSSLKTKVQHNPFEGFEFPGSVDAVFVSGALI